ncbi:MAG TPA: hypothetical protein ACFYD4_12685 [Candidatus Wunengus sp. YC61]|uniref:hypothetical protein n=1 Tax=Candidatus Wunengus sp. YC61 TaxID=3367698 RepID=UPI004024E675
MKNCNDCKNAVWQKTEKGRLHPSGEGRCNYDYKIPQLPESFYWIISSPRPSGGQINRREELKGHCVYWGDNDKK